MCKLIATFVKVMAYCHFNTSESMNILLIGSLLSVTTVLAAVGAIFGVAIVAALLYWLNATVGRCFVYGVLGMVVMTILGAMIGFLWSLTGYGNGVILTILFALGGLIYGVVAGAKK